YSSFLFTQTPTPEIYTLSLHDALPICSDAQAHDAVRRLVLRRDEEDRHVAVTPQLEAEADAVDARHKDVDGHKVGAEVARRLERSEEHTSELQSPCNLVCRLLLEKKK